jgi:hypothetical protein
MPANITFTALLDDRILWANRAAATAFFNAIQVPNATEAAYGSVKQADAIIFAQAGLDATTYATLSVMQGDGSIVNTQVASKNSFDELKAAYVALKASYDALLVAIKNAGQMNTV